MLVCEGVRGWGIKCGVCVLLCPLVTRPPFCTPPLFTLLVFPGTPQLLVPSMARLGNTSIQSVAIAGFGPAVHVFQSKQKPKKLTIIGEDLQCVAFNILKHLFSFANFWKEPSKEVPPP